MSDIEYNVSDIIDFSDPVPVGDYVAKTINIDTGETKAGDPTITVTFEVQEGEYRNQSFDKVFFMKQGKTKNGGTWCRGISDLRADAKAIGRLSEIPKSFTLPHARAVFAKVYGKSKLQVNIRKEPAYNNPEKEYNRYTVTGLAGGGQSTSDAQLTELLG